MAGSRTNPFTGAAPLSIAEEVNHRNSAVKQPVKLCNARNGRIISP